MLRFYLFFTMFKNSQASEASMQNSCIHVCLIFFFGCARTFQGWKLIQLRDVSCSYKRTDKRNVPACRYVFLLLDPRPWRFCNLYTCIGTCTSTYILWDGHALFLHVLANQSSQGPQMVVVQKQKSTNGMLFQKKNRNRKKSTNGIMGSLAMLVVRSFLWNPRLILLRINYHLVAGEYTIKTLSYTTHENFATTWLTNEHTPWSVISTISKPCIMVVASAYWCFWRRLVKLSTVCARLVKLMLLKARTHSRQHIHPRTTKLAMASSKSTASAVLMVFLAMALSLSWWCSQPAPRLGHQHQLRSGAVARSVPSRLQKLPRLDRFHTRCRPGYH